VKDFFIDGDKQTPSVHFTTALYYTSTGLQNQMQRFPYNLFRPGLLLHAAQASLSAGKAEFFATRIPVTAAAVLPCVLFTAGCLSRKMLCSSNVNHQTLFSLFWQCARGVRHASLWGITVMLHVNSGRCGREYV